MTQEDKQLLLVDLCARLPYRVKVLHEGEIKEIQYIEPLYNEVKLLDNTNYNNLIYEMIYEIKPYLRPMSSMSEEEKEELRQEQIRDEQLFADCIKNHPEMRGLIIPHFAADWCDKNMFDYRGLIEKGLAIAVTEDNNPYKK